MLSGRTGFIDKERGLGRRVARCTVPIAAGALVLTAMVSGVHAVDRGTFELDGNATASATLAGDDWGSALNPGLTNPANYAPSADQLANTGVAIDPENATIFTTGGSKDDLDITSWRHTNGSVPDKDEITNAYAAAYKKGVAQDLVIYFGADRFATNGNAALGFWFFQQQVGPLADGTFSGSHSPGDLLILSEFTNGGSQPTIQVYEWRPGPGAINGTLRLLTDSSSTCNATQDATKPEPNACAIVNTASTPAPWPYTPKSGASGTFGKGAFFEGGVNVSQLFAAAGQSVPCFSSFLAETRSSQSVDATLKDFDGGAFPLCSGRISITGDGVNEVGQQHTFNVKVEKTVAGTTSGVSGVIPTVTLNPAPSGPQPADNGTCDEGTDLNGECTVIFNSDQAGIIVGSAAASFTTGGQTFNVATGTTAATGAAVKRYVDAKIAINPPLDTNGITESHTFTVKVEQDDGYPAGATGGDAVTGFGPAPTGTKPTVTLTESAGAAVTNKTDNCATTGTNPAGECTVVFTSNSAGTVKGTATATLSFAGLSGTVTRSTDATAANSGEAVKHFVDGSLTWLKHDQDGALLGGATFEVCRTTSYNSATDVHTALSSAVCQSVTDNSAPDTDADAGEFKLVNLVMGRYTVKETAAPAGYSFDPNDVKSADVETAAPNASITVAFVNVRQFKMIVITCNQVTNELVKSQVTLNGVTKDTIDTPTGVSSLCSLGGANYGNLNAGTYKPDVVIPKPAGATP